MEKISGIIPASPRVTNVDVKDTNNMRVTMPNKVEHDVIKADGADDMPAWKAKDAKHVAIVNEVANNFFMKKPAAPEPKEQVDYEDLEPQHEYVPMQQRQSLEQPEGLFPKGSFIDRSA